MLKKQNQKSNRLFAIFTLFVFLFSNFNSAPQAAASDEVHFPGTAQTSSFISKLSPTLGHLKEVSIEFAGNSAIIHIQDAHAVPDAQRKIQDILRWISQEEKNKKVVIGLEGAAGEIHPEYLDLIKGKAAVNEAVVTDLWEKGEITGADLFAWELYKRGGEDRQRIQFVGIETPELYRKNLLSYRTLLYKQQEILTGLSLLHSYIDIAKTLYFTPELMEFVREKERRKEGRFDPFRQDVESEIHLDGYMQYLVKKAAEVLSIDLRDPVEQLRFPNLSHLFSLDALQKSTVSQKAGEEKEAVLQKLQDKNLIEEIRNLESSPSPRAVIETLYETAPKAGIELKAYPEFLKWAATAVLKAELKSEPLFEEMGTLETLIFKKIAVTENQNKVLGIISRYDHLEKLLLLKLSRDEFSNLNENLESFSPAQILKDAESLIRKKPGTAALEDYFKGAVEFYTTAVLRDQALLDNLIKNAAPETVKILISGGFHTDGLTALMRQRKMGYAVVLPVFSTENSKGLSAKVFKDENADISNYFSTQPIDKQSRLFLKELIDVAFPKIDQESKQDSVRQNSLLREAVSSNPVLSEVVSVNKNSDLAHFSPAAMLKLNTVGDTDLLSAPGSYHFLRVSPASARAADSNRFALRAEIRTAHPEPQIFFSSLLASQYYGQRDRKFYAFLPPEGKISVVLKIGGKKISAKILFPDGSFAEKEIHEDPVYANAANLDIDLAHITRKKFDAALRAYAHNRYDDSSKKTVQKVRSELEKRTLDQMAGQIAKIIAWAKPEFAPTENIFDIIHTIGITAHGPFVKDNGHSRSGTFAGNPAILPFLSGTSIAAEIKNRIDARFPALSAGVQINALEDMTAAGAGEISKIGSFPNQGKAMYVSWGTRIASSLYVKRKPFLNNPKAPVDFGEIGEQMIWFPETRSYEWMGKNPKTRALYAKKYRTGNDHYGSENMAAYFGKDDFRNLRPEEVIRAGWDMGRMIAAYVKAIRTEYGSENVPQKIILGSVVPEDLGLYNPYLIDAVREGFHRELERPVPEELGYTDGVKGKHNYLLLNINSRNEHDLRTAFKKKLSKYFGKYYARNYMRAFEETNRGSLETQLRYLHSIHDRQIKAAQLLSLLTLPPASAELKKIVVKTNKHIAHHEYATALSEVQKAYSFLSPDTSGDVPQKKSLGDAITLIRELLHENTEAVKNREGRLGKELSLPFRDWETPALYGGPGFNREEWNQVMETWREFGHQVQEERTVEVGRDPGAGSTAAKKSVRLLMSNREEIARLMERGLDVRVGPWAGPHFVKSRETGDTLMHVGYVGSNFAETIKSLLPPEPTVKANPDDPNVVIFSGGSGAPGLHVPILHKLKHDDPHFKIAVLLTNTDDGGSSWKLVEALIKNGYGIYPPFGDIVNALFNSFLPPEMLANILDDGGRLANKQTNQIELHQSVRDSVKERIAAARENFGIHEGHALFERFNMFETKILNWMDLVDKEFFNDANPILKKKGASIRNLVLLGALLESGTLRKQAAGDHPNALYKKEDQAKFQATLNAIAEGFGIKDAITSVSSFDDATLWAEYEENVILFKDELGNDVAIATKKNPDGSVSVRDPRLERAIPLILNNGMHTEVSGVTIGNEVGVPYIEKNNQKWFVAEDTSDWKTYLDNRMGKRIEIFNDGSGRPAEIGRKFEKTEAKGEQEKELVKKGFNIGGQEIYIRSRFIVRQTNATETANFSRIINMGALRFMGNDSLQDMNPSIHGKTQYANPEAVELIEKGTDLILMGPGSLHTSLMPHLLSKEIIEAMIGKAGKTKRVFVFNPNRDNETIGMSVEEIIEFIERIASRTLGKPVNFEEIFDTILINNGVAPAEQWKEALLARHEIRIAQPARLTDRLGLGDIATADLHQKLAAYPRSESFDPRTELFLGASRLLANSPVGFYDDPELRASNLPEAQRTAALNAMFVSPDEAASAKASKADQAISQSERAAFVKAYAAVFQNGGKVVLPAQALAILNSEELQQYVEILMDGLTESGIVLKSPVVIIAGSQNLAITPAIRETIQKATVSSSALRKVFTMKPLDEGLVANQYQKDAVAVSLANAETDHLPNENIPTYILDLAALKAMKQSSHRIKYLTSMTQLQFLTAEELRHQVGLPVAEISQRMAKLLNRIGIEFGNSAGGYLMPKADSLLEGQVTQFIAFRKAETAA